MIIVINIAFISVINETFFVKPKFCVYYFIIVVFQNNKFINDIKDENQIESDIEELSKKIKELKLNVEETI